MNRIIFATGNAGKMKEIREILGDMDAEILSMKEAGIKADIVEDGTTFEENAKIKAQTVAQFTKDIVLADDSGLEVETSVVESQLAALGSSLEHSIGLYCQSGGMGCCRSCSSACKK